MKQKTVVTFAILASLLIGGFVGSVHVFAKPLKGMKQTVGKGEVGLFQLLLDISDVNITAEQKAGIRDILKKYWDSAKPLLQRLNQSRIEMREVIKNSPFDEEKIRGVVHSRSDVTADLAVLRGKVTAEIRTLLTPEQERKIEQMLKKADRRLGEFPNRVDRRLNEEN